MVEEFVREQMGISAIDEVSYHGMHACTLLGNYDGVFGFVSRGRRGGGLKSRRDSSDLAALYLHRRWETRKGL